MSNFKIIVTGIFVVFAVFAVLAFSGAFSGGQGRGAIGGEVTIWGTIPMGKLSTLFSNINQNNSLYKINYIEKRPETFHTELVEALASGSGPDIFMLSQDLILRHSNKVFVIPYSTLSERQFKNTFVQESELYLTNNGILALPFSIDPLVMYWNRDILSASGVATTPKYWSNLYEMVSNITKLDQASNITQNTVALGTFDNILYAKDILSILMMQAGNPIITTKNDGSRQSVLSGIFGSKISPAELAVKFYTEFSNPSQPFYSWNGAEALSIDSFSAGKLALYFGYASDLSIIKNKNPHLNFDVAILPQAKDSKTKITFGKINGLAISKNSKNIATAFEAVKLLTDKKISATLSETLKLPSPRRDILSLKSTDPYLNIFNKSALISRAWLDPSPKKTDLIFKDIIEGVSSGRYRISESINRANSEINQLLNK